MDEMDAALNKIKQVEELLKKQIMETYGKFLPENSLRTLLEMTYTNVTLLACNSMEELRGKLLRRMLDDIIELEAVKEISLEDGNTLTINYGYSLEDTLINYYAKQIADKYHFNIDEVEGLKDDLETVKALYEKLGEASLNFSAFNEDAIKLLEKADIKEITDKYDKAEIENYFNNLLKVAGMAEQSKEEQNKMMKDSTDRINSIQIVWLHDKKHIKYIDPYGEVHLTDISKTPKVEEFYKQKLASLGPDEKIDPEKFHRELQKYYADEMELLSTRDVKEDELNSKQVNMLEFIKTNDSLRNARTQDIIKHNSSIDTHVLKANNDIVTTEDKSDHVEAHIVKDGNATMSNTPLQENKDISTQLISKQEYIRLNDKLFNGEELSLEELEALRRAASVYAEEVFDEMHSTQNEEGGTSLKPKNTNNTGFTIKTFAEYFIVITILIATIVAIIILR